MQILQKRQTGENEIPTSLTYGEIAIDKRGRLHTADETGTVVDPLEPALDAVSSTQYDVKMLQLQAVLEKKEPPMLGGFVEAFGDTKKRYSATKCTVDTTTHQLKFDGTDGGAVDWSCYAGVEHLATYQSEQVTALAHFAQEADSVEEVRFSLETSVNETWPPETLTGAIYGRASAGGARTKLSSTVTTELRMVHVTAASPAKYAYYELELTGSSGYSYQGYLREDGLGDFESLSDDGNGVYPAVTATVKATKASTQAEDGSYITKVIELGVPVESGEVYLHYPALPEGATLAVKLGTDTKNHVALSPEGEERTVTLGSTTLKERKYLIPPFAEAVSGVSVRIDGHREKLEDVLAVSDICVAMR